MKRRAVTRFSIKRFHPETDSAPRWQRFDIETKPGMTVLDALHRIREQHDATLSWRYSCRMGICGSCGMVMNGKPGLACNTQVHHLSRSHVRIEPLWNFSVVKDLVTDLGPMFENHRRLKPFLVRTDAEELRNTGRELSQTPGELLEYLQFSYCIKCGACVAACPTVAMDRDFPGPMPLAAAHRYNADTRDDGFAERSAPLAAAHGVSHCHYAGECSRVCPKGVDPARAIQLARRSLIMDLFRLRRKKAARPVEPQTSESSQGDTLTAPPFTVSSKPANPSGGDTHE